MNIERYILSPTAKKRRRVINAVDGLIVFCMGAAMYALVGILLRYLGVV